MFNQHTFLYEAIGNSRRGIAYRSIEWLCALMLLASLGGAPVLAAPLTLPPSQTISVNTNFQGGSWINGANSPLTINPGVVATLDNGNTFTFSTTSNPTLNGGGRLVNAGTFDHSSGGFFFLINDTTFDNVTGGILNFNNTNGRIHFNGGANGNFRNLGGTINVNANNVLMDSQGLFTTFDGVTLYDLNLNVNSGSFRVDASKAGGQVRLNTLTVAGGTTLTLNTPSTFTKNGGGAINFNQPGRIQLGSFGMGAAVTLNAGGDLGFIGGTIKNNGNDMTLASGRTLDVTGGENFNGGTGRFINDGIINLNTAGIFFVTEGAKFENNNTLNFNTSNARIHLNTGANGTFRNYGGTINVSAANSLLDGSNGTFTTFDGTTLHDLNINITSGDFTLNVGNGDQIRLNTVNNPLGSALTLSNPATFTKNGGGTLNFNQAGRFSLGNFGMGADVILNSGGNHGFIGGTIKNNGNNLTLATGRTLDVISGGNFNGGTGRFINDGIVNLNTGGILFVTEGAKFENNNTLNFNQTNARVHLNTGANGTFRNYGGTINVSAVNSLLDGSNGTFTTFDGTTLHDLNINITSGDFTINVGNGDQVRLNTVNVPTGSKLTLSVPATFTKNGGGAINFNQNGRILLGNFKMGADVNLNAGEDHGFIGGTIDNLGNNLTLFAGRNLDMTGGGNFVGSGSVINNGNMNHNYGGLIFFTGGVKLENNGIYSMNLNNARLHLNGGANGTINNNSDGTFTKAAGIAYALIDGTSGTFNNQGTIFVPGGELEIGSMNFTSFSANTLTAGTYTVDSTATGSSLLDLQPANSGITTIGTNATVNLIGTGASIQQLTSTFNTLNGQLKLSEGKVLNLNNLTMNSTSQLTFGLDDLASSNSKINLTGSLSANGLINIEDLGGLEIGVYDLISVAGLFTDNGLALGSVPPGYDGSIFNLTLLLPPSGSTGGIVQLSVEMVPAPEPGSATLLGLGLVGAMCFRRRRRAVAVA